MKELKPEEITVTRGLMARRSNPFVWEVFDEDGKNHGRFPHEQRLNGITEFPCLMRSAEGIAEVGFVMCGMMEVHDEREEP